MGFSVMENPGSVAETAVAQYRPLRVLLEKRSGEVLF